MRVMGFKKLLENTPEEIEIPNVGRVKVRMPTLKERLEVKAELKKLPNYDMLTEQERASWEGMLLAAKCLVEPKLSIEDILNAPEVAVASILNEVSKWYYEKVRSVSAGFLGEMRERSP